MTYFLGFDVAKAKLDYSLINERGIEETFGAVSNDRVSIATLLLTVAGNYPDVSFTCAVEATSWYHQALTDACEAIDMPCIVYNPLITKQQTKITVRGKKTDRYDAFLVARVGWSGGGRLHTPELYRTTKHYARGYQKLTHYRQSLKLYNQHLADVLEEDFSASVQEVMSGIQAAIAAARQQLYVELAASAQGEVFRLLQTIPGIGPYVAASLLGEVQDMRRFTSTKAITAFTGFDPKIRQSGTTLNSTGKLTKRGSPYLRRSLFIAANAARQVDPQFRALYERKRTEGKSYKVAICVVARKLLAVVRSVWLSGKDYKLPAEFA